MGDSPTSGQALPSSLSTDHSWEVLGSLGLKDIARLWWGLQRGLLGLKGRRVGRGLSEDGLDCWPRSGVGLWTEENHLGGS